MILRYHLLANTNVTYVLPVQDLHKRGAYVFTLSMYCSNNVSARYCYPVGSMLLGVLRLPDGEWDEIALVDYLDAHHTQFRRKNG